MAEPAFKPMPRRYLFNPPSLPPKGMISALNPAILRDGYFAQLTNLRFDTQLLYVRPGAAKLTPSAITGATVNRGAWQGYLNGTEYAVAAYDVTTNGKCQIYSLNVSTFAWTEISNGASGAYQNTRLTTGYECSFAAFKNRAGNDVLLICNGHDQPVIYDPTNTRTIVSNVLPLYNPSQASVVFRLPRTEVQSGNPALWAYYGYLAIAPTGTANISWTYNHTVPAGQTMNIGVVNSSTNFFMGWVGPNIGIYAPGTGAYSTVLQMLTGISGNPTITISLGAGSGPLDSDVSQLTIWCNNMGGGSFDGGYNPWPLIEVSLIDDNSTEFVLYDPAVGANPPAFVTSYDPLQPNSFAVVYSASSNPNLTSGVHNIQSVKLKWKGGAGVGSGVNGQASLEIFGIQVGGGASTDSICQGGSTFTYSLYNSASGDESPGWVIGNYQQQPGSQIAGISANFTVPLSPLLRFQATAQIPNASSTEIGQGVDTVNLYYQAPGTFNSNIEVPQAPFIQGSVVNTYSGSWPTSNAGVIESIAIVGYTQNVKPSILAPDAFTLTIPVGAYPYVSNGRLYVGGVNNNQVYISDLNLYQRFESQVRFIQPNNPDQTSATFDNFPSEIVTGIAKIGGSYIGIDPIIVFTNASVYRIDGANTVSLSRPTRIAQHGMPFGNSFTEYLSLLYWVDEERQVTVMGGGTPDQISRNKVSDKLALADLTHVSLAVLNNRVHVAYKPSGGTQDHILIYESFYNEWCEDVYPFTCQNLLTVNDLNGRQIWSFDGTGLVYMLEKSGQTTDDGTGIGVAITGPIWNSGYATRIKAEKAGMIADASNNVLTVVRNWQNATINGQSTANGDGVIDLNTGPSSPALLEEYFDPSGGAIALKPGGSGSSVQFSISGTMPGNANINALWMKFDDTGVPIVSQSGP